MHISPFHAAVTLCANDNSYSTASVVVPVLVVLIVLVGVQLATPAAGLGLFCWDRSLSRDRFFEMWCVGL
jgi:hypothetical protein